MIGVYCIENTETGKRYIGQSIDIERRKFHHQWLLKKGNHFNSHLQNSYNKYGKKSFIFYPLLYCEPFELTRHEQFFVDMYTPEVLYNICTECVDSSLGAIFSEEHKRRIAKANTGKKHSEETKRKISKAKMGKKPSAEARKRMSESQKGRVSWNKGGHHSEETKRKLSIANSGVNNPMYGKHLSEEAKRKIAKANSSRCVSEETRRRMSESQKKQWAKRHKELRV